MANIPRIEEFATDLINIRRDLHEHPELGMEAIWKIKVEKFPAFLIIDNKGNDFYENLIV